MPQKKIVCQWVYKAVTLITTTVNIEQGAVPCFVMLCSMMNIKYTEQIIGSALFL